MFSGCGSIFPGLYVNEGENRAVGIPGWRARNFVVGGVLQRPLSTAGVDVEGKQCCYAVSL